HTVAVSIYALPNESLYVVRKFLVELHPPRPASDEPACAAWAAPSRRRTKPDSRRRGRVSRLEPRPLSKLKADSNANLIKTRFGILLRHFDECK
ncbi:hypothetical protein, partial [Burkholderia cenocepacia]|uniref:hypothetical protein n=1 Tax=Burkholderia cenocepacia TaxID=95486 RepID=UPI002AB7CCED